MLYFFRKKRYTESGKENPASRTHANPLKGEINMKKIMITISREYGSGGHDIGKALAEKLGLPFYDNELIAMAARDSGHGEAAFEQAESGHTNSFTMAMSRLAGTSGYKMPLNDQLFMIQHSMIRTIADAGSAVFVGRCADYVLEGYAPCVNIFIQADRADRIKTVIKRDNLVLDEAEKKIDRMDKSRATYYNYYTDRKWGDRSNYDIILNSSIGTEAAVDLLAAYIRSKVPDLELG